MEEWRPIKGYEGLYEISNLGRVKSLERIITRSDGVKQTIKSKILKGTRDKDGYLIVGLSKNYETKQFKVHRLVAETFISNPDNKPEVDHINTNRTDNVATNLRWCTHEGNCNNVLSKKKRSEKIGKDNPKSKKVVQLTLDGDLVKVWDSAKDAVREEGFSDSHISNCCKGKRKTHRGYKWVYYEEYIK